MRLIRSIQDKNLSRLFMPLLAVLFVFSLSFHSHGIALSASNSIDSHNSESHSDHHCSACLLQGTLQIPKTGFSLNNNNFGQLIAYISIDFTTPNTFVVLSKPSRAPPAV